MKAIILVAGMGTRIRDVWDKPKSLFEINDKTILEHSLDTLIKFGVKEIILVIGYKGNLIKEKIGNEYNGAKIEYAENKEYMSTGLMYSFFMTKDLVDSDVIVLEGDLIYEPFVIKKVIESKYGNLFVLSKIRNEKTINIIYSDDNINIKEFGSDIERKDAIGEFIGITKLSKSFVKELFDYYEKEIISDAIFERFANEFAKKINEKLVPLIIYNLKWSGMNTKEDMEKLKNGIFQKIKL